MREGGGRDGIISACEKPRDNLFTSYLFTFLLLFLCLLINTSTESTAKQIFKRYIMRLGAERGGGLIQLFLFEKTKTLNRLRFLLFLYLSDNSF